MRMNHGTTIVNSWNEWDSLERVIVGRIATDMVGAPDPGAVYSFPEAGIEAGEERLMDQLDGLGFDVVPVDFFEVSPFGGGLHCSTVDVYRQGDCVDYFPKQIDGF